MFGDDHAKSVEYRGQKYDGAVSLSFTFETDAVKFGTIILFRCKEYAPGSLHHKKQNYPWHVVQAALWFYFLLSSEWIRRRPTHLGGSSSDLH